MTVDTFAVMAVIAIAVLIGLGADAVWRKDNDI